MRGGGRGEVPCRRFLCTMIGASPEVVNYTWQHIVKTPGPARSRAPCTARARGRAACGFSPGRGADQARTEVQYAAAGFLTNYGKWNRYLPSTWYALRLCSMTSSLVDVQKSVRPDQSRTREPRRHNWSTGASRIAPLRTRKCIRRALRCIHPQSPA